MYQNENFQNIQQLSSVKSHILTCAIFSVIFAIPIFGWILSVFFFPTITLIIIASITLSKVKKYNLPTTGLILVLCASICSIIGNIIFYTSSQFASETEMIVVAFYLIGFCLLFTSWILFINAAVILFKEHNKIWLPKHFYNKFPNQSFTTSPPFQHPTVNPYVPSQFPTLNPNIADNTKKTYPETTNSYKSQESIFSKSNNLFHTPQHRQPDAE